MLNTWIERPTICNLLYIDSVVNYSYKFATQYKILNELHVQSAHKNRLCSTYVGIYADCEARKPAIDSKILRRIFVHGNQLNPF